MEILITGDLVINKSYNSNLISDDLKKLFSNSDYNIVNLEAPVTDSNHKIIKTGPHLKSKREDLLKTLQSININMVTLANNHIRDYSDEGVIDTIKFCQQNLIETVGAGRNVHEAALFSKINSKVGSIAIINIAENEWASASVDTAGANGMNIIKDVRCIHQAKEECDYVFVIIHGGHEYYNLPSPRMQEQYRFYADQGADLIIGHHPHCISGFEIYNGTPIYYSLGNFIFTEDSRYEEWYIGTMLKISITEGKISTQLIAVQQSQENYAIKLLSGGMKEKIDTKINNLSEIITNKNKLQVHWLQLVKEREHMYLNYWSPLSFIKSRLLSSILYKSKITMTNKKGLKLYSNLLQCEAHNDLSREVLKKKLTEYKK